MFPTMDSQMLLSKDVDQGFGHTRQTWLAGEFTHRLLSSSFLGLPYRILNMNHKKEVLRSLWVSLLSEQPS